MSEVIAFAGFWVALMYAITVARRWMGANEQAGHAVIDGY